MANFKDLESTKISARFDGNFDDFDINLSKQMSGYFIITKRGGYNSELVCQDCNELIFKDCIKSVDEIKEIIAKKDENMRENSSANSSENSNENSSENSLNFENSKNSTFEAQNPQKAKPAFEIIEPQKPKISQDLAPLKPKAPAFEIEEEKIPFEIEEQNEDYEQEESIEEEILPKKTAFEIEDENFENSQNDEISRILENDENSRIPENNENSRILENNENSRIPQDDEKIFFAKNIELSQNNIVEIEVIISGYDEFCDSFNFLSIPHDCEYKYSIKIGELKAVFIANMTGQSAKEFINGFSFKTKRKTPKIIKIFINENSVPALCEKLFV